MLLHVILLFLGSLAVAEAHHCLGDNLGSMQSEPTLTLACASNEEIEYAGLRFDKLDCAHGIWTHNKLPLIPAPPLEYDQPYPTVHYSCKPEKADVPVYPDHPVVATGCSSVESGPDARGIVGGNPTNRLTVVCPANREIEYAGLRFERLECADGQWTYRGKALAPAPKLVGGNRVLEYACVGEGTKVPADTCYMSIKGVARAEYTTTRGEIVCKNEKVIAYGDYRFDVLRCTNGEWKHGDDPLDPPVFEGQNLVIKCVPKSDKPADTCKGMVITGVTSEEYTTTRGEIVCKNDKVIAYGDYRFDAVRCTNGEWKHGDEPLDPRVFDHFNLFIKCVPKSDEPEATSDCLEYRENELYPQVVINQNTISCDAKWQIEYAERKFDVLQCDNGEWKHGNQLLNPPVAVGQPIDWRCVPVDPVFPITSEPALTTTTKQAPVTSKTTPMRPNPVTDPEQDMTTTLDPTTTTVEENWVTESGESTESDLAEESQQVSTTTIICCVIGGLVLIGLAIAALLCYRNAKYRTENSEVDYEKTRKNYEMSDSNMDEV